MPVKRGRYRSTSRVFYYSRLTIQAPIMPKKPSTMLPTSTRQMIFFASIYLPSLCKNSYLLAFYHTKKEKAIIISHFADFAYIIYNMTEATKVFCLDGLAKMW